MSALSASASSSTLSPSIVSLGHMRMDLKIYIIVYWWLTYVSADCVCMGPVVLLSLFGVEEPQWR